MPHHVRQMTHHNINQDETTSNIERPHRSVEDPEVKAALAPEDASPEHHKPGREARTPPRGLADEYNETP